MNSAKWTCRITAAKAALRNLKAKITSSLGNRNNGLVAILHKAKSLASIDAPSLNVITACEAPPL
jgi:hypothetical protein